MMSVIRYNWLFEATVNLLMFDSINHLKPHDWIVEFGKKAAIESLTISKLAELIVHANDSISDGIVKNYG